MAIPTLSGAKGRNLAPQMDRNSSHRSERQARGPLSTQLRLTRKAQRLEETNCRAAALPKGVCVMTPVCVSFRGVPI